MNKIKNRQMNLRLSDDEMEAYRVISERCQKSVSELIRDLMMKHYQEVIGNDR